MAAGNHNQPEGKDKYKNMIDDSDKQYFDDVIVVGASTEDDEIWGYSASITYHSGSVYGPVVDMFAPGSFIRGATHSSNLKNNLSAMMTQFGTSFVSPNNKGNPKSLQLHHMLRRHPTSLESSLVCSATLHIKISPQRI